MKEVWQGPPTWHPSALLPTHILGTEETTNFYILVCDDAGVNGNHWVEATEEMKH